MGYIEPLEDVNAEPVFENMMIGNVISPSWMAAIEKVCVCVCLCVCVCVCACVC